MFKHSCSNRYLCLWTYYFLHYIKYMHNVRKISEHYMYLCLCTYHFLHYIKYMHNVQTIPEHYIIGFIYLPLKKNSIKRKIIQNCCDLKKKWLLPVTQYIVFIFYNVFCMSIGRDILDIPTLIGWLQFQSFVFVSNSYIF